MDCMNPLSPVVLVKQCYLQEKYTVDRRKIAFLEYFSKCLPGLWHPTHHLGLNTVFSSHSAQTQIRDSAYQSLWLSGLMYPTGGLLSVS